MSNDMLQQDLKPTATLAITGAAPQTAIGNYISTGAVVSGRSVAKPGTLSARLLINLTTTSLALTGKWQVSEDATTWYDVKTANAAANVALATGSGSLATYRFAVSAPEAVLGWRYARYHITSSGGTGGGAGVDDVRISYACRASAEG